MKLHSTDLASLLLSKLKLVGRYRVIIFIVAVVTAYGYLVLQINSASNVQPANSQQVTVTATPHIDESVVRQLQQLQDNSVSVKALFNQARSNPFQ